MTKTLTLSYGSHKTREGGMCLMEAVAFLAGEKHSDRPKCACPVLSAYGRALNDLMGERAEGDALRAKYLAPLAEKLAGTRSTPEVAQKRALFFIDRAVRLFAPMALESAGLKEEAKSLRGLPEIVDKKTAADAAYAAWAAYAAAAYAAAYAADAWAAWADAAGAAAGAGDAAAYAAAAARAGARSGARSGAWEQAAKVLAEACEITSA